MPLMSGSSLLDFPPWFLNAGLLSFILEEFKALCKPQRTSDQDHFKILQESKPSKYREMRDSKCLKGITLQHLMY